MDSDQVTPSEFMGSVPIDPRILKGGDEAKGRRRWRSTGLDTTLRKDEQSTG
jgi:hypothetical protein